MSKLWKKSATKLNPLVEKYTVGDDYLLDLEILPYDIQATKAHIKGLKKIGIITAKELSKLTKALSDLEKLAEQNKVKITPQDEDCHTVIENYLVKNCGDAGKKVHTGRSRNDQVLVAIRLYMKAKNHEIAKETQTLAKEFLKLAKKYQNVPFPGYTHTQQAMLSSLGHYFGSFTESLIDDLDFLEKIAGHIDKNPLGSAAGFGVNIKLDRALTTKELNFKSLQLNSLYCQNSRGKFESAYLESLTQIMLTLGRFAQDLLLFTSQEFNFFTIDDTLVTGSSIMPQKRNLDAMEILRGNVNVMIANQNLIQNLTKGLISGYNRDLQLIKKPLIESSDLIIDSLKIVALHLQGITPNKKIISEKITKEIFMADLANDLAKEKGLPFRDAYVQAHKEIDTYKIDLEKNIKSKLSPGAPGNLQLESYEKILKRRR